MVSEKDGSPMVFVPAGDFTMGSTSQQIVQMVANCNEGANVCNFNNFDKEIPQHEVYLDSYYIDQYEVTNARYAKCVAAGICQPPKDLSSSTYTNYYGNHDFDNYPIIRVNWSDAKIYCGWREDRLPSEAEWEKAARGTDERVYPWGDNIDCSHANYSGCVGETVSVGSYESGKSPYDVYDMAGNVWEWVNDWYGSYQNLHVYNPLGPSSGEDHILRGGSWYHLDVYVRSTWRTRSSGLEHLQSTATVGFRCAKSAP